MKNRAPLDWNDLRYFLAVARAGGLTPAAEQLRTSPSTVSRHINAMEETLAARLFLRQQSGYQLTDQGSALFEHVAEAERAILAVERNGEQLGARDEIAGLVRLGTSEMLANQLIAPRLGEFAQRYPKIQVELIGSRELADLSRREADLALRIIAPKSAAHHPDYIAHCLGKMSFVLYGAVSLVKRVKGDGWKNLPYIAWDQSWDQYPGGEWLVKLFPGKAPALRANSMQAHYAAARSGLGIAGLPKYVGDSDPLLKRVGPAQAPLERDLWLVYHRDMKASRRVLAMRDFVEELVQRYVLED